MKDHYETLGVGRDASFEKIKRAYRKRAKSLHPDAAGSQADTGEFLEVGEAYDVLRDEEKRRRYDAELARGEAALRAAAVGPDAPGGTMRERGGSWPWERRPRGAEQRFQVILTAEEASEGVLCPLDVVVAVPCPHCGGRDVFRTFFCPVCCGSGEYVADAETFVEIPPGVRSGAETSFSCRGSFFTVEVIVV